MGSKAREFDRIRSMLDDPRFSFQQIGQKFGLTKQRIAQLAKDFGIDGRQRQRERTLRREPYVIEKDYLPDVSAILDKIKSYGFRVLPYNKLQRSRKNQLRRSQKMVLVNGVLCVIQLRPARKLRPNGREYVRFDVGSRTRRAKLAVFAMRRGRDTKIYIVPTADLRNVEFVYIPADGKYAGSGKKPRRDWTHYENAWHLLGRLSEP